MKKWSMAIVVLLVVTMGVGLATAQKPSGKPIVRLDPALDALVSPDAKLELVKGGFGFTEGALWVHKGKTSGEQTRSEPGHDWNGLRGSLGEGAGRSYPQDARFERRRARREPQRQRCQANEDSDVSHGENV